MNYGETNELAFIVMEFVEGRTLKAIMDGGERLPLSETLRIRGDNLTGLARRHARGVVHCDIKPTNTMIAEPDKTAKIADFGIARIESSGLTKAGKVLGTPAYLSPEQFMGQAVDGRTDTTSSIVAGKPIVHRSRANPPRKRKTLISYPAHDQV